MKKYKLIMKEQELSSEIEEEFRNELGIQRKKYPAKTSNMRYIDAAKIVAKKFKIKPKDILKHYTPSNNIAKDKTWDKEGNIK